MESGLSLDTSTTPPATVGVGVVVPPAADEVVVVVGDVLPLAPPDEEVVVEVADAELESELL